MTEKLEIVQIEESEEESQVMKLSETYWKDYLRDNEYNKDPNKMCELCIEEQIKKHGQQVIPCTGINRAENKLGKHLFDQIVDTLTPEEKAELDALYDPYVYMDTFLDIGKPKQLEDRWYQKIISACLHGDSLVSMSDGSYKKIKDIKIGDKVVSYNETKRSLPINKVTNVWNQGIKPVYRVTLENGDYLDCTRDHPILSHFKSGKENKLLNCPSYETTYKSLEDGLDVGMDVYTVNKSERWGKFSNTDVAKLLSRISELDLSKRSLKRGSFNTSTRTKIVSIEYIGEHTTYDIEVENRHNFVANNIIVHNCSAQSKVIRVGRRSGKTYMMALMMVHEMLVNDKYRVLVVSPYAVQTGEVIKTFLDLCSRLPDNPVKSSKQTPVWEINFHNGSVLMGFTAATNADSVRGQTANRIVLDEVDDIPEAAIVSVMAIKMSVPDVKVWRSGTPKGERNLNRAEQDPMNKCFHYPSYVIPHYDDKMDASLRHEMGDGIGYVQEVMAIIGVANDQVFQSMFLNRAQNKLKFVTALDVIADRSRYIVTIGVDWNHDKVGTRIIVLAYDKIEPQFYIIDKEIVAIEGKTQHAAQDKIIRLNRKYNCEHIFVDKGFGTTQIANIKQFALAQVGTIPKGHPDLKLLDMLAIDYGSSTEVQDPVTGEIVKHPTKQMAVMNAVEVLEKDLIALHPKDDHDIIKQFKNYVEKSRNKGKITYGYLSAKVGDHDLDAIMIALFGMKKTYSSIFISESTQALIKFVDKNDENREESDFDEVTNMLFGISFGRKSQNNKRTENLSSNRSGGFNRRDRGRF